MADDPHPRSRQLPVDKNGHRFWTDGRPVMTFHFEGDAEPSILASFGSCGNCGEYLELEIADGVVRPTAPCAYSDGITTTVTIEVPSGKLLVTDDLRPVFDAFDDAFASYNSARGQAQVVEAYAALGCAYGPVGNSCPGFYRTGDGTFVVANPGYDEGTDREYGLEAAEKLAGITTDLWAYSMVDLELWKSRGGDPSTLGDHSVVEVEPGTYRFTHHTGELGFDRDAVGVIVFAHVETV